MSSLRDIPFEDILVFLDKNNIGVPQNEDEIYDIVWDLIQDDKHTIFTEAIVNWMKAYNSLSLNLPHYYEPLSDEQIKELKEIFDVDNVDDILDILFYANKLVTNFDLLKLPKDIINEVISNMNINEIENICNTSNDMKRLCQNKDVKNIIIEKLPDDSLFVNDFSLKQLFFYNRVLPLKCVMTTIMDKVYVNIHDKIIKIGHISINPRSELEIQIPGSNQIIEGNSTNLVVLMNDGKVYLYNKHNKDHSLILLYDDEKIVNIVHGGIIHFTSINGNIYSYDYFNNKIYRYSNIPNVIQSKGSLFLNENGQVYIKSSFNNKIYRYSNIPGISGGVDSRSPSPRIKQLVNNDLFLTEEGDVYRIIGNDKYEIIPIHDIKQITSTTFVISMIKMVAYLNNEGNVFFGESGKQPFRIMKLSNIIEITFTRKYLVALDNNYILHFITGDGTYMNYYNLNDLL